ncbi:14758_t:CDS:2 [Cetraspora pellucida]|uniref:14758_t:CDS:1 n=1 Tax=Cetraspora pellucida TaxID=1433469 RepID=A0A9N8VEB1_9GLOM|nr:14758_t:CDS:2 [Cetraspora pellucida]
MSSLPFDKRKSASLICHLRKDMQEIVRALRTDFPGLRIKNYYDKSDPVKKTRDFSDKFQSCRLFGWRIVDFLKKAGMVISIIEATPKSEEDSVSLIEIVKICSSVIKAEEISDITNANILNHKMTEHLENKLKKTLKEIHALNRYHIAECYRIPSESLTEEFIMDYGKYDEMKWFRNLRKLRDVGIDNKTAVEAITREDYRNDRFTTVTRAEKHRICLELIKTCTPIRDIDDRSRYKVDNFKRCLNTPESIQYLHNLVPKMARVFDNTDASHSAKKSGLKSDRAKLGMFDKESAPKLPSYQTDEGQFYENGEDMHYRYSKLLPDELEIAPKEIFVLLEIAYVYEFGGNVIEEKSIINFDLKKEYLWSITTKIIEKYNLSSKIGISDLSQYTSEFLKNLTNDKKQNQACRHLRDGFKFSSKQTNGQCGSISDKTLNINKLTIRDVRAEAYALALTAKNANAGSSRIFRLRRELRNIGASFQIIEATKFPDITEEANKIQMNNQKKAKTKCINYSNEFILESVKERLNVYDIKTLPDYQALADVMVMLCIRPAELRTLRITVTGYVKNRGQLDIPRKFRSMEKNQKRAKELLTWIQRAISSCQIGDPGKPGVKWFNKFLKDYDLIPKYLRKLGAVYAVVTNGVKNMAHAYTIAGEALWHSCDNHTSSVQNYVVVNYRKRGQKPEEARPFHLYNDDN